MKTKTIEILEGLLAGAVLGAFTLFILSKWIDDSQRQNRETAQRHQAYLAQVNGEKNEKLSY